MAGGRPSEAADIYAFSMTLYEMLARQAPFRDGAAQAATLPSLVRAGERPRLPMSVEAAATDEATPEVRGHALL